MCNKRYTIKLTAVRFNKVKKKLARNIHCPPVYSFYRNFISPFSKAVEVVVLTVTIKPVYAQ